MDVVWAHIDNSKCPCKGKGWALRSEGWEECPVHFIGQLHPQSRDLLIDNPEQLKNFERKSHIEWRISVRQSEIKELEERVQKLREEVIKLERELINRTATVKMKAVRLDDPEIMKLDAEWNDD